MKRIGSLVQWNPLENPLIIEMLHGNLLASFVDLLSFCLHSQQWQWDRKRMENATTPHPMTFHSLLFSNWRKSHLTYGVGYARSRKNIRTNLNLLALQGVRSHTSFSFHYILFLFSLLFTRRTMMMRTFCQCFRMADFSYFSSIFMWFSMHSHRGKR